MLTKELSVLAQVIIVFTSIVVGFKLGSSASSSASKELNGLDKPETHLETEIEDDKASQETLEELADGDLAAVRAESWEPCKLVLVVRGDLHLDPANISTQCSDATLACYKALLSKNPQLVRHWEVTGQAKIALKGTSHEQLSELEAIAKSLNLCARFIHNKDLTKNSEDTGTVLGIGPAPVELINQVTGKLRLL
ncbi:hypothetical protein EW145_g426 [Phellinidium pouzarii]|uniref:peptidyl-tRNA hydrolase n=1 Tax=Phellinidium pouzarii TaxID=167371 RepID=A0A4S4LJ16_9AGAM|nr:hypothetical protein EW145_g426 [Phellinidium pouzarii]